MGLDFYTLAPDEVWKRIEAFVATMDPLPRDPRPADIDTVLACAPVFGTLDPAGRKFLAERMQLVEYAPGEALMVQGSRGASLFVLAAGRADMMVASEGSRELITIDDLHPGDLFGFTSLFDKTPQPASCIALSPVSALTMDHALVAAFMATDDPIGRAVRIVVVRALAASLREANAHLAGNVEIVGGQGAHLHQARRSIMPRKADPSLY